MPIADLFTSYPGLTLARRDQDLGSSSMQAIFLGGDLGFAAVEQGNAKPPYLTEVIRTTERFEIT